jgi:predicted MFS family arabinose efflux permease
LIQNDKSKRRHFGISRAAVGGVITATQLGCALALLLVVPLNDLLNRKRLICVQLVFLAAALQSERHDSSDGNICSR